MAKLFLFLEFLIFFQSVCWDPNNTVKLGGSIFNADKVKVNRIVLFNTHFLVL